MNTRRPLIVSLASLVTFACIGALSTASAQGLTRAQVREQLIEAQANGSQFVTDSSYPDVTPRIRTASRAREGATATTAGTQRHGRSHARHERRRRAAHGVRGAGELLQSVFGKLSRGRRARTETASVRRSRRRSTKRRAPPETSGAFCVRYRTNPPPNCLAA